MSQKGLSVEEIDQIEGYIGARFDGELTLNEADARRLIAQARLSATPPLPAGDLVLVPREPTEEMQKAGRHAIPGGHGQAWLYADDCYRAMIAAAPTPPLPVEGIGA